MRPAPRHITSWQAAEQNAADWMRSWGYHGVHLTRAGSDSGIDVRATGAIAQVKAEAALVGRPALQRLVGARENNDHLDLLFFTGMGYSAPALDYATTMGIALFTYQLDGRVTPANATARRVSTTHQDAGAAHHPGHRTQLPLDHGPSASTRVPGRTPTPSAPPAPGVGCGTATFGCITLFATLLAVTGLAGLVHRAITGATGTWPDLAGDLLVVTATVAVAVLLARLTRRTYRRTLAATQRPDPDEQQPT